MPGFETASDSERQLLEGWLAEWYAPAYRTARLILANPDDAQDAVQDAFLRLWRFRASIPEGDSARAWLYRVVVNACFSAVRREQRATRERVRDGEDQIATVSSDRDEPGDQAIAGAVGDELRRAIAELPDQLRVPLVLRYYSDLSEREIAVAIHRRPGTVKSRLHEARRRLESDGALVAYTRSEGQR